jgi:hypothetical protein
MVLSQPATTGYVWESGSQGDLTLNLASSKPGTPG